MKKCLWLHDWIDVSVPADTAIAKKYRVPRFRYFRYCKRCEIWQTMKYNREWVNCEKPVLRA
jgi:hypothetical protein